MTDATRDTPGAAADRAIADDVVGMFLLRDGVDAKSSIATGDGVLVTARLGQIRWLAGACANRSRTEERARWERAVDDLRRAMKCDTFCHNTEFGQGYMVAMSELLARLKPESEENDE